MKNNSVEVVMLCMALCWSVSSAESRSEVKDAKAPPNVLFIAVDDLNDYPTYAERYPDAITPNLDRLAKQGVVFEKAYCQWPTCGPSRNSVMSGLLPTTVAGKEKWVDEDLQKRTRELGTKLVHEYFSEHGYTTLAVGKLCHDHVPEGSVDESGGRGSFTAGLGRMCKNYGPAGTSTDWFAVDKPDEEFPDYEAASWAINQLQKEQKNPFMLMVGFIRPHVPWYVNKKWFDLYDPAELTLPPYKADDLDDVPPASVAVNIHKNMPRTQWAIENNQWRNILHAYLASVSFMDHQLGRILDALEASPYKDNTVIVLWSDHGYHMGEKNSFQKHSLWDRAGHVPLLFAGTGIEKEKRCGRVVSLLDIYPTLLELCGLPENPKNEGRSLVPLLNDPKREWPYPALTAWRENCFALQAERYRYMRYKDGSEELYDHQNDPNEWTNLAENPEFTTVKVELQAQLDALEIKGEVTRWGK
ncbi:sulfatase [Pontiella agarivorans]|uniref:Sulfatase n=1 Tax=Pontiella agarivorans TaxID=3038953 RepID=A0ABU5N1B9_9BACT|nr:sulfatase [Pontiella agarivorans]MDZ8120249.1 sulfatase [Pontiella agarivorans]